MFNRLVQFFVIVLASLWLPAAAFDDVISTVHLKDGTTVAGKIIKEHSDMLIIEADGKSKSVDKKDIARIARADNYSVTLTQAFEFESAGKFGDAIEKYQAILQKDPEHKEAAEGKARMLLAIPYEFKKKNSQSYQTQNYERLIQLIYNELGGVPPDSPRRDAMKIVESEIYTFMGQDKMKRLVYEQAEQDFRRALRLNPQNFTAALMLGDLFSATGRWGDAYDILRDVIQNYPDNVIAHGLLMQAAFHTKNFEHGLQEQEALSKRDNLTQQEKKFVDMCMSECREMIAEALKQRADTIAQDGDTSAAEELKKRSEDILNMPETKIVITDDTAAGADSAAGQASQFAGKSTLLIFTTSRCPSCIFLKRDILPDSRVQTALGRWDVREYNAEGGSGARLARKYNVTGVPSLIFLDSTGGEIKRIVGSPSTPESMVRQVSRM